jgi:hypothetical protein
MRIWNQLTLILCKAVSSRDESYLHTGDRGRIGDRHGEEEARKKASGVHIECNVPRR